MTATPLGTASAHDPASSLADHLRAGSSGQHRDTETRSFGSVVQDNRAYRGNLNALSVPPADGHPLVADGDAAFTCNGAVFDGLVR
jgi:hypothetical protein